MRIEFYNKRKGSAMVFMLIVFLIISIFSTSILFIFNSNLKQTKHQRYRMEAYYLAYSGAEAAYLSLLENEQVNLKKILDKTPAKLGPEIVKFGNGEIHIKAEQTKDKNFEDWIKITSTGILDKNGISYTRSLYFDPQKPIGKVWKDN